MEVGEILEGKVTGITKFGAFVSLPGGKSGLVHISEVANAYVSDINEFLQNGQMVKVKVLAISPEGKINLSIKKAMDPPAGGDRPAPRREFRRDGERPQRRDAAPAAPAGERSFRKPAPAPRPASGEVYGASGDSGFEDKLAAFLKDSNSKMSGNKLYEQQKRSRGRRK